MRGPGSCLHFKSCLRLNTPVGFSRVKRPCRVYGDRLVLTGIQMSNFLNVTTGSTIWKAKEREYNEVIQLRRRRLVAKSLGKTQPLKH